MKDTAENSDENEPDSGTSTVGKDLPSTKAEARVSSSHRQNDQMLVGQNITIALVASLVLIGLIILLFISYKTKLHKKVCKGGDNERENVGVSFSQRQGSNGDTGRHSGFFKRTIQ